MIRSTFYYLNLSCHFRVIARQMHGNCYILRIGRIPNPSHIFNKIMVQIAPQHRLVNENSVLTLVANVSYVVPSCTLTWYFATEEYLTSMDFNACDDCQVGTWILKKRNKKKIGWWLYHGNRHLLYVNTYNNVFDFLAIE